MATITLTKDNFEEVITANDIVLIDFWAPWCGPCRAFGPVFEALSEEHPDAVFAKVNTDEEQELAGAFEVSSIPTLIVFREQVGVFAQPGALPEPALRSVVEQVKELDMKEVRKKIDAANAESSAP